MNKLSFILIFLSISLLVGCNGNKPDTQSVETDTVGSDTIEPNLDGPVLAVVNGDAIHKALLNAYFTARRTINPTAEQKQFALDDLINLTILKQQAEQAGVTDNREFQALLRLERLRSVASAMAREYTAQNTVTENEAQARYQSGVAQAGKQEFELSHILVTGEEAALDIIAQLEQGDEFATLAQAESIDTGSGESGSLGWVNLAELPPPLARAVKQAPVGQIYPAPVQSPFGWHVILVEAVRPFTPPAFDEVKAGLVSSMQRQRIQQYVSGLRESAQIEIRADFGVARADLKGPES